MTRCYDLFGLTVASAFAIPWAPETEACGDADVIIRRAGAGEVDDDGFRFEVPAVARYRIVGGREIIVDPDPGVSEEAIRLYLLGSALGVLLHQRGLLVLHANAIVIDGAAVLFMGPSGAGKSTLAAWFASRGYPVLTDDICAVEVSPDGAIRVLPGLTRLRLAEDATSNLGIDAAEGELCPSSGKREIGLARRQAMQSIELRACYLLSEGPADAPISVRPLAGVEAVEMLMANTYRGVALHELGGTSSHLAACLRVAEAVSCFRIDRARSWRHFDAVADELLRHSQLSGRRGAAGEATES